MLSDLKALRDIISTSVDAIASECEGDDADFPSLNEPFQSSFADPRRKAGTSEAIRKIVAASQQLIASVQAPQLSLVNFALAVSDYSPFPTSSTILIRTAVLSFHLHWCGRSWEYCRITP